MAVIKYTHNQNLEKTLKHSKSKNKYVVEKTIILLLIFNFNLIQCSDVNENFDKDLDNRVKIIEAISGRSFVSSIYNNGTFRTGNNLWDKILNQCTRKPSVSCLQKNVFSYLDDALEIGDVNVTSGICFTKNKVDVSKYSEEVNKKYFSGIKTNEFEEKRSNDAENEIPDGDESETPIEEVTDALYDRSIKFLVTHDLQLTLPEFFFHGSTLKVSPRALTKTGALIHLELEPKVEENGEGRIFFKKIKKYIKKKLVMAAIAIFLVIKLIVLKVVFVLPLITGVATAKKLLLKLLLFVFPALSHIFKLCSWYHQNYHTTKFHHHHHLITHHHKTPHHPAYSGYPAPHSSVLVKPHVEHHQPSFEHYPQDWELSGPGLGNEYIAADIHRNAISNFKPQMNDINDINAWGLGLPPGQSGNVGEYAASNNIVPNYASPGLAANRIPAGGGRPVGPPNPYYNRLKKTTNQQGTSKEPLDPEKEALIRAAALAARIPPSPVRDEILRISAVKLTENERVNKETELVKQQQQIIAAHDPDTVAAERFYGALVEKVESILTPLGAFDDSCRQRAVCALYRDPFRHTPYSNLVSNELSKDSSELLPPADSKNAVKYYNFVQAARDGQEHKECATVYSSCNVDYGK